MSLMDGSMRLQRDNCGSFLIQNSMQMKEIQTSASTCKFGNIRNSLLIDRMGYGMSDPT